MNDNSAYIKLQENRADTYGRNEFITLNYVA